MSKLNSETKIGSLLSRAARYLEIVWSLPLVRKTTMWLIVPSLIYLVLFFLMQPHYLTHFTSAFYLDNGDGFQNVWNMWWVDHALTVQHVNPYFTTMIHWPHGTSLLPQTMNIYNCIVGVVLMHVFGFSLIQAVNFAVLFSFVFGGVTMMWFIQKLYSKYWVSLFAGALFTFSSYHFAHAQGHLQLVSFEFIPLFFLAFWTLLEKMRYKYALMAAGALLLVLLCDYYYFFWSVIAGGMWFGWSLLTKQVKHSSKSIRVLAVFSAAAIALAGPLVYSLLRLNKHDTLLGAHNADLFSLDPLSIIMPGGSWYWHALTDGYTNHLSYFAESSMFFGFGLLALLIVAFVQQFIIKVSNISKHLAFWWIVLVSFGVLALGPHLKTLGHTLHHVLMPYGLLAKAFPTLELSGMPIRWILISLFAAIVIGSWVLSNIKTNTLKGRLLIAIIILVSLIDLWPRPLPLTPPTFQPYVYVMKKLPLGAMIDDAASSGSVALYNQTYLGNPIAFGYVTRLPKSVDMKDYPIFTAMVQGRYSELCSVYKIRYITKSTERELPNMTFPTIFRDQKTIIYDLKNSANC